MKQKFALVASMMAALLIVGTVLVLTSQPTQAASQLAPSSSALRISQAYGGGGNSGASYKRDFIEIFNGGSTSVNINGWSVQYTSAAGTTWTGVTPLSGTLAPGQYYLVAEAAGANVTTTIDLPTPDVTGTIAMGAAAFKVALVNTTTLLTGGCPITSSAVLDFVGAGTANCYEGTGAAPAPSNTASIIRGSSGCLDTDINATDFITVTPPMPRNTASAINVCPGPVLEADLGVSKTGPATAIAGETITYTINLSNTGNYTATGTLVTDTLPVAVSYVGYTTTLPGSFVQNGQSLQWNLGDLAPATNATIAVQVAVSPSLASGSSFTNTVIGTTTYTETTLANNSSSATTYIGSPDLTIVKTGPASANAGDTFTYTLAYTNDGTINASGVVIVDQLPAGVTFVTETTGSAVVANGTITWTVGALNASIGSSIDVAVTADYAGNWVNTATISGGPIDSDPLNNTSSVTTTINGADPYVLKTSPAVAFAGELVTYTLTYGNSGSVTATATLTDQLPIGFTTANIAADTSGLVPTDVGDARVWTTQITPTTSVSFTLALTVPASIASGTRFTNTLTDSAIEAGDNLANDTATAASTAYQIVPIATARAGSNGQVFAVEGNVTVVPATYSAGEWELQDASGGITAFYSPAPTLALGDRVRLVGVFDNTYGAQPELSSPRYFANLGSGSLVNPIPHQTGDIPAGATPGWLVTISGTLSGLSTCSGNYHLAVNDGSGAADIFINSYSNPAINPCGRGFANGDWIQITGFSTLYTPTYEVRPRLASDLVQFPRVLKTGPASGATEVSPSAILTATFNMTMTNVGDVTFLLQGPGGAAAGTVGYDPAAKTAIFTPTAALVVNTLYTATLKATLTANNGRSFMPAQDYAWSFRTHQTTPDLSTSTKTNSANGAVKAGEWVTYTITLNNTGDGNATAIITDVLDSSYYTVGRLLDFTQPTTGTLTWTGMVTAGQSVSLRFVAQVKSMVHLPIGPALLLNSVAVNDGMHAPVTINDPQPPTLTIYGLYLPLVRR